MTRPIFKAAFLAMLLASPLAQAYDKGHGRPDSGKRMEKMMAELDLTDAQKTSIQKARASHHATMVSLRTSVRSAKDELHKAFQADANEATLRKHFDEVQKAKAAFEEAKFAMALAVRSELTPDQRKKFDALKKERRDKKQAMRDERRARKGKGRTKK